MARKRNRYVTIDTEVEVDIDENLEYATDEALLDEANERGLFALDKNIHSDVIMDLLCSKYTIIQASYIRQAINKILNQ